MTDKPIIESGLEAYGKNSALRTLVQTVLPGVGIYIDNTLINRRDELQRRRVKTLIDELDRQECDITSDQLNDDEFCHAVIVTVAAAARTSREEKIHKFANLLVNYQRIVTDNNVERYEELLRILDDMSLREYHLLLLLYGTLDDANRQLRESQGTGHSDVVLRPVRREYLHAFGGAPPYWGEFMERADEKGYVYDQIPDMFERIARTGLYLAATPAIGEYWSFGTLSNDFYRFVEAVERHAKEHE